MVRSQLWLYMTMYGYVWLCIAMYGYVWLCMNMYGYVQQCMSKYDYSWLWRKREREKEVERRILNTFSYIYKLLKFSNNNSFFTWYKCSKTFHSSRKVFSSLCLPLVTFVYVCLSLCTFFQMTHPCTHFVLVLLQELND